MKITGPQTVAGKTNVGPVNFLYVIMFKIVENVAKFILGPVKVQKFSRWLTISYTISAEIYLATESNTWYYMAPY